jgi:hypothetical protein
MTPRDALLAEGLREDQITYENDIRYEDETGFFSYRMEHGFPYITHFLIWPDKRKGLNFLNLYHKFREMIIKDGHLAFIAEVIPGKEAFEKFVQGLLGCKEPYAKVGDNKYYFIRLLRGKNASL